MNPVWLNEREVVADTSHGEETLCRSTVGKPFTSAGGGVGHKANQPRMTSSSCKQ